MPFYDSITNCYNFSIGFDKQGTRSFTIWAKGYHKVANLICDEIFKMDRFPDYVAYPVLFNYRHSLELYLKGLIYDSIILLKHSNKDDLITGLINNHRIGEIYKKFEEIINIIFPEDKSLKNVLKRIKRLVNDLIQLDPDSFTFRYPIDTKGELAIKNAVTMNLKSIRTEFDFVLDALGTLTMMVDSNRSEIMDELSKINYEELI